MIIKPKENPIIGILLLTSFWDSGINSLTTTYIIQPEAKDKKNGINGKTYLVRKIANTANSGSTIPDRLPYINDFNLLIFLAWSGMDIIDPSGKFWIAIPKASANAPAKVIVELLLKYPENTNPTAIPSGILWSVTAKINVLLLLVLL